MTSGRVRFVFLVVMLASSCSLSSDIEVPAQRIPAALRPVVRPSVREAYVRLKARHGVNLRVSWNDRTGQATYLSARGAPLLDREVRPTPVNSEEWEALARSDLRSLAGLLNERATNEQLTLRHSADVAGTHHRVYQQVVAGVPVFSGELLMHFDGTNRLTGIASQLASDTADVEKVIAQADLNNAPEVVQVTIPASVDHTPLHPTIYRTEAGPRLAWRTQLPDRLVLFDHLTGDVLFEASRRAGVGHYQVYSTWDDSGSCKYGILGEDMVGCAQSRLSDCCTSPGNCASCSFTPESHHTPLCPAVDDVNSNLPASGPGVTYLPLARNVLQSIYEHFNAVGVDSFDGNGQEIAAFLDCRMWGDTESIVDYEAAGPQYIKLGRSWPQANFVEAPDAVAHEFAHLLQANLPLSGGLLYGYHGFAIHEGIADVLALLFEASFYSRPIDWEIGTNVHVVRDIASPPGDYAIALNDPDRCIAGGCHSGTTYCRLGDRTNACSEAQYTYNNSTMVSRVFYDVMNDANITLSNANLERVILHAIRTRYMHSLTFGHLRFAIVDACFELEGSLGLAPNTCSGIDQHFENHGYGQAPITMSTPIVGFHSPPPMATITSGQDYFMIEVSLEEDGFVGLSEYDSRNETAGPARNYYQSGFLLANPSTQSVPIPADVWSELTTDMHLKSEDGRIYYRLVTSPTASISPSSQVSIPPGFPPPFVSVVRRWPNGTLLRSPAGAIYLVEEGTKRLFSGGAGGAAFIAHGYAASHIVDAHSGPLTQIPTGPPMAPPAERLQLFRTDASGSGHTSATVWAVWYWRNEDLALVRRKVLSEQAFDSWGFTNLASVPIDDAAFSAYPEGPPLAMRAGRLVMGTSSQNVYVITDGAMQHIQTSDIFEAMGYAWGNIETIPQAELDAIPVWRDDAVGISGESSGGIDVAYASASPSQDAIIPAGHIQAPFAPLTGGDTFSVYWYGEDATTGVASIQIEYTLDDWDTVARATIENLMNLEYSNTTYNPLSLFDWPVPDVDTDAAGLRLLVTDRAGNLGAHYSRRFTIVSTGMGGGCQAVDAPLLFDPGLSSPTGDYTISWTAPPGAVTYELQEDTSSSFGSPTVYALAGNARWMSGRTNGTWYYRVKAFNDCEESAWSNIGDIIVSIDQPPSVPANPSPANNASSVSRTPTLTWTGSDSEGPVEFAVKMGTDPADLNFVRSYSSSPSYAVVADLNPATQYYWQVLARDSEQTVTEGPVWRFTTTYSWPDLVGTLDVAGPVAPGSVVNLDLTVENQGTYASEPCQAWLYYAASPGGHDSLLVPSPVLVPALAPGASTVVSTPATLWNLVAGTTYAVAEVDSSGFFVEANISNNTSSFPLTYVDSSGPVIDWLQLRYGSGPMSNQYQSGHEYQIAWQAQDDVGIGCAQADLEWSTDGGNNWSPIVANWDCNRTSVTDFYMWTIPPATPFTVNADLRLTVYDDVGHPTVQTLGRFEIVDGSTPEVTVDVPNGGEVWALSDTQTISWTTTAVNAIGQVRVYLHYGDQIDQIASFAGSDPGSFDWSIPSSVLYATQQAKLRVRVTDTLGNEGEDFSDDFFELRDASAPPPAPWTTPQVLTSVGSCGVPNCLTFDHEQPRLAVDSHGDVHLAYVYLQYDYRDGFAGAYYVTTNIFYVKNTGGTWGPPEQVTAYLSQASDESLTGAYFIRGLDIAVDSSNRPYLVWSRSGKSNDPQPNPYDSDIMFTWRGGTWSPIENLSNNASYSWEGPEIVVASDDTAWVLWTDGRTYDPAIPAWSGQKRLYYRSRASGSPTWSGISTTLDNGLFGQLDATRGYLGEPHILYVNTADELRQVTYNGASFDPPAAVTGCAASPSWPSIAASASGEVDATAMSYGSPVQVFHGYFDGATAQLCDAVTQQSSGQSLGPDQVVRHDASGLPTLVWRESGTPNAVYFQRLNSRPDTWSSPTVINLASQFPMEYSLSYDVGPNDVAHVAWITYSAGHGEVHYNFADIASDTEAPVVNVTAPLGGVPIGAGLPTTISWTASDNVGVASYNVAYSLDQGQTLVPIATINDPAQLSTPWTPPASIELEVIVVVTARDAAGNEGTGSSGTFALIDGQDCVATLLAPNGSGSYAPGNSVSITWTATDDLGIAEASLYYSTDDGMTWTAIAEGIPNAGSYGWTVPYDLGDSCRVMVAAVDTSGRVCDDQSDGPFIIATDNGAPSAPFGPMPADLAAGLDPNGVVLSWRATDPDNDPLTFEIYFATSLPFDIGDLVAAPFPDFFYAPGPLTDDTTYYWRIVAWDGQTSTPGPIWTLTTGEPNLPAPSGLTATAVSSSQVQLSWTDNASDETGFEIERKAPSGSFAWLTSVGAGSTGYLDGSAQVGVSYRYRVRAMRAGNPSAWSNEAGTTTWNNPPLVPSGPTPELFQPGQPVDLTLSWVGGDPDPGDAVLYSVYFGVTPSPPLVAAGLASPSHPVTSLNYGTFYYWRVSATDGVGDTVLGPLWTFVTMAAPPPSAPTGLVAIPSGPRAAQLTWSHPGGIDGYRIERQAATGAFLPIATVLDLGYLDTTLLGHTNYTFRVRAVRDTSVSAPSNTASLGTGNADPTILSAPLLSVVANSPYVYQVVAQDEDYDFLSYDLTVTPIGMTITTQGLVEWTPNSGQVGSHSVIVTVSDDHAGTTTQAWTINVASDCVPVTESCNNQDDDCDGQTDEDWPELDSPCTVGQGECAAGGLWVCTGDGSGSFCAATPGVPTTELCGNGLDDDCDGSTDEDFTDLGNACTLGQGACEAAGQMVCAPDLLSTECNAAPRTPGNELCGNTIDDDCDGDTDEDYGDLGNVCTAGQGTCESVGQMVCAADLLSTECNATAGTPGNELCGNSIDDDCDGSTDEGFPDLGTPCTDGLGACQVTGDTICAPDGLSTVCSATAGSGGAELCSNAIDDDCDGSTDEGFPTIGDVCTNGQQGACEASGNLVCSADGLSVECDAQPVTLSDELCGNLVDDDCDGSTDEGFDNLGTICTVGQGACEASGSFVCTGDLLGTECDAAEGDPVTEICDNAIDDDCDGLTDQEDAEDCPSCELDAKRPCGLAIGACEPGIETCVDADGVLSWSECQAAVEPTDEVCDNLIDENCDGTEDEGCGCEAGELRECGPYEGECSKGQQTCADDGTWGECQDAVLPELEVCDLLDNDCDGQTDEGCACTVGDTRPCGVSEGPCEAGTQSCFDGSWGGCEGATAPTAEACGNELDDDCDGLTDEPACVGEPTAPAPAPEEEGGCGCRSSSRSSPAGFLLLGLALSLLCKRRQRDASA